MKQIVNIACMLVALIGCAGMQPDQANRPHFIYTQKEFRICITKKITWFSPESFRKDQRDKEEQLKNMGAPGNVISDFRNMLPQARGMELMMEREIHEGAASFYYIGIQLKPDTRLTIQQGAFRVTLNDPVTEQAVEVADEGVLVYYCVGRDRAYYDSSLRKCDVYSELQRPKDNMPLVAYMRLPMKYEGWTISGMILDPNKIQIASK